jgi:hypothetical protein
VTARALRAADLAVFLVRISTGGGPGDEAAGPAPKNLSPDRADPYTAIAEYGSHLARQRKRAV